MKKRYVIGGVLLFIIVIAFATNPTVNDYLQFSVEYYGNPPSSTQIEVESKNFLLFSTYTPIVHYEHGITHIGAFGNFFQISGGQFNYPKWLNLFK